MGTTEGWRKRANSIAFASARRNILAIPAVSFRSLSAPFGVPRDEDDEDDEDEKWRPRNTWRKNKMTELKLVGLLGALIASGVMSSFSWAPISNIPTATIACWFSALLLALTAVGTATQQAIVLSRLATVSESRLRIFILPDVKSCQGRNESALLRILVWQAPVILLSSCIGTYIIGIMVLAFTTGHVLVAIIVGVVAFLCFLSYSISTIFLDYRTVQVLDDLEAQFSNSLPIDGYSRKQEHCTMQTLHGREVQPGELSGKDEKTIE